MSDSLQQRLDEITKCDWSEEDRKILQSAIEMLISMKIFIPKKVLQSIIDVIDIGIREKKELDALKSVATD
jgi:hypothetical protein